MGFGKTGLKHRPEKRKSGSHRFTVTNRAIVLAGKKDIEKCVHNNINKPIRMLGSPIQVPALLPPLEDIKFHCLSLIWNEPKLRHQLWCVFWKLALPKLCCRFHKREENRRY